MSRLLTLSIFAVCCTACLDRPETEPPAYSSFIVPEGVEVRSLERTMAAKTRLDLNDGLTGPLITLHTGYAAGHEVKYWDLGQAPTSAEPMWIFVRREGERGVVIPEHPPVIDSIPGDSAYSPIRLIFEVAVTSRYSGQRFPSLRAIEDGAELGLLEQPRQLEVFTNCVVTLQDNQFEVGEGLDPRQTTPAYYRDRTVYQFCVGDVAAETGLFAARMGAPVFGNAYLLRHEDEVPTLDESVFKSDLNDDGDTNDSNVVFDSEPGDTAYTSLWRNLDVVVSSDYAFGAITSQEQMFDKKSWGLESKDPRVIEYKDTGLVLNRPILEAP